MELAVHADERYRAVLVDALPEHVRRDTGRHRRAARISPDDGMRVERDAGALGDVTVEA